MGFWKQQKDMFQAITSPEFAELYSRSKQMEPPSMLDTIRQDPEYANGNYTKPPSIVKYASVFYSLATAGGTLLRTSNPRASR